MIKAVLMPQFGATMLTGTVIHWLKKEGDQVKKGEPLLEVMTDKVVMEVESFETGIVKKILAQEGDEIPVSQVIAYIGEEQDTLPQAAPAEKMEAGVPAARLAAEEQPDQPTINARQGRLLVSPVARKLAEENGIDLTAIQGTEPGGRIGKGDVLRAIKEKKNKLQAAPVPVQIPEPLHQEIGGTPQPVEFYLPKMTDNMASAIIAGWLVKNGAEIVKGQPLLDIETDKSTIGLESPATGILTIRPGIEVGVEVPVGETLAYITAPGAAVPRITLFSGTEVQKAGDAAQKEAMPPAEGNSEGPRKAVPAVRRLARELGVDLALVNGSSAEGLITEKDVRAFVEAQTAKVPAEAGEIPSASAPSPQVEQVKWLSLTPIQRVTGQRMLQSMQTAPQFSLSLSVDMTRALEFRQAHLSRVETATGERLSITTILVKVVAMTLRQFPKANASFEDKRLKLHQRVNIGVAIGATDGLVVPVIKDADRKSLIQITREMKAFQEKAGKMRFDPDDLSGGTFTISNLGMFGIERFNAIVNPPESAILAVGQIIKVPMGTLDDRIVLRPMMSLTLSIDHRVLDGLQGAQILTRIKEILEQPCLLVE